MTRGTQDVFESARQTILESMPTQGSSLAQSLSTVDLSDLAQQISEDGRSLVVSKPVLNDG
jgi:hypothetical protein